MEKLSWMFELLDRMSGPADRISKSLKKLDPSLKTTGTQTSLFSKIIGGIGTVFGPKASGAVLRFASSFVGLSEAAKPVMAALGGVAKGALVVGGGMVAAGVAATVAGGKLAIAGGQWLMGSIAFKETTIASLEAILQSKEAAVDVFNQATKFAAKTPFSTSQVASAFERLVAAGVEVKDLEKTMQSLGDFAGTDATKLDGAISVLAQIKGKGKLQGEELMQLAERGLPMGKVLDELAKKMGKTKDEVQSLLSAGKINSETGIGAIMGVIDSTFGGRMEKSANTLEGLWSTLQSVPEDLIFNSGAAGAIEKMIGPIKKVITSFTAALSPDTANGQRLIAMFDTISTAVAGAFNGFTGEGISKGISKILDIAEPLLKMFMAYYVSGIFEGLSKSVGGLLEVFSSLAKKIAENPQSFDRFIQSVTNLGQAVGIALGVVAGITAALAVLGAAVMASVVQPFEAAWDIGKRLVAVLTEVYDGVTKITSAGDLFGGMRALSALGAPTPGAAGHGIQPAAPGGSTAGAATAVTKSNSVMFNVPPGAVQVNVAAGDDPASAGKAAADSFMGQLGAALKGMATEAGM